jgi:twinkle protein
LAVYDDGHTHCFVCGHHTNGDGGTSHISTEKISDNFSPLTNIYHDLRVRSISKDSVKRYGVDVNMDRDSDVIAKYPVFKKGEHVGNKIRKKGKVFFYEGDAKELDLFGQHAFPEGSAKAITIVEGQDDALAAYELTGSQFPCVSVHGSSSAVADCKRNYEYLNSFNEIVICFDRDEAKVNPKTGEKVFPGQDAAIKVAGLFKPGKVRLLTLREFKDPNEYLEAGRAKQFVKEWWGAPTYKPDGLKLGTQMWDEIINRPNHFTVPWPFEALQKVTYGIRLSEFILVHAPTGVGKTSIIKEVEYALLTNKELQEKDYGVGFLHLEEPNHDTALGLMSVHNSKPYHLPDTERNTDELRAAYDSVINTDRVVIWDHFGSNSVDAVLEKVRHMHALGCKYIVVDHLSIIVSDQSGDERKQLDEISTKLKTLCMELNIALICVIHQNRAGLVRGTAGVEQVANIVIRLERDKTAVNDWRRNITKTTVEKNRFSGTTGPASYLHYNPKTGRLEELDQEEIIEYEAGNERQDDQVPF